MATRSYCCISFPILVLNKYRAEIEKVLNDSEFGASNVDVCVEVDEKHGVAYYEYSEVVGGGCNVVGQLIGEPHPWAHDEAFIFKHTWNGHIEYPGGVGYGVRNDYVCGDEIGPVVRLCPDGENINEETLAEAIKCAFLSREYTKARMASVGAKVVELVSEELERGLDVNCVCITQEKDKYELEVVECRKCGFHLGVDASWLVQTQEKGWELPCPACNTLLFVAATG